MLKSYEAIYDHGRIQWLSEPPKVEHFKMLVVVEQSETSVSSEHKQKRRTPPPELKNSIHYLDDALKPVLSASSLDEIKKGTNPNVIKLRNNPLIYLALL